MGNSANIFLYAGNGKYFQELFALTLNRIVVSGWYVSSMTVVQHAGLINWFQHLHRKRVIKTKRTVVTFLEVEQRHNNPVASFQCASLLYMLKCIKKSTHQPVIPQQSTQNTTKSSYRHKRKTS